MLWLAAVAAAFVLDRNFRRAPAWQRRRDAVGMVAVAVVAGIVGAKLWHVLDTPDRVPLSWAGAFSGIRPALPGSADMVFGISALVLQGWRAKIGGLRTLDLAAPSAAIGYGIGRIGCFLSGDGCYGLPTKLPWGMSFPNGIEPTVVRVHPTPLYELAAGLLIGGWLWWRGGKNRAHRRNSGRVPDAERHSSLSGRVYPPQSRSSLGPLQCPTGQPRLGSRWSGADHLGSNAPRRRIGKSRRSGRENSLVS